MKNKADSQNSVDPNIALRLAIKEGKTLDIIDILNDHIRSNYKDLDFKTVDEDGKTILDLAKQVNQVNPKDARKILGMIKSATKDRHGVVSYYFNEFLEVPGKVKQAIIEAVDYCYKAVATAASMILQPFKHMMKDRTKPVDLVTPSTHSVQKPLIPHAPEATLTPNVHRAGEARSRAHGKNTGMSV